MIELPYGPFKPAYLTVKVRTLQRIMMPYRKGGTPHAGLGSAARAFLEANGCAFPWEEVDPGCDCRDGPDYFCEHITHYRLTFRDDFAAAEFALRYA